MHCGGNFSDNPQEYVGGDVGVVDNCDPDKWPKVEIEDICKDFGYTSVSRLWYKMPGENQEGRMFHLIMDDDDTMFMTDLVRGHAEVHVYVGHPVHDPILINGSAGRPMDLVVEPEDTKPLVVGEPEGYYSSEPTYDGYYGQGYFYSDGDDGGNDWVCNQNFYDGGSDGGNDWDGN